MRPIDADVIVKFIESKLNEKDPNKQFGNDAVQILAEIEFTPTIASPRDWTPCAEGQNLPTKDGIYLVTYKLAEYGVALLSFSTATYGGGWNIPFPEHHFISEKDIIAWSEKPDPYNPDQFREPTKKMPDCLTCNTRDKCTDKLGGHVFCFEADGDG